MATASSILILMVVSAVSMPALGAPEDQLPRVSFHCESDIIEGCLMLLSGILGEATPAYRIVFEEYVSPPAFFSTGGADDEVEPASIWGIYSPVSQSFTDQPVPAILDSMLAVDGFFEWIYDPSSRTIFVVDKFLLASSAWVMNATIPSEVVLRDVTLGQAVEMLGSVAGVKAPPAEDVQRRDAQRMDVLTIEKNTSFRFAVGRILQHAKPEITHFYATVFTPRQRERVPFTAHAMRELVWHLVRQWHPSQVEQWPEGVESIEVEEWSGG